MQYHQSHGIFAVVLATLLQMLPGTSNASSLEKLFAPKAELWDYWSLQVAADKRTVDHSAWNDFLKRYAIADADGIVRIAYGEVTPKDKGQLSDYTSKLSTHKITSYSRAEQFAYWVNLYNALTVQVVLDHYPVASIRDIDISPGFFADGPWGKALLTIEGKNISLNDIEHRILRPIWGDPRIHYAVNCASIGCPNLQPEAFSAANSERLLERASREYINHPRGVSVGEGGVKLSSIYNWFEDDFSRDGGVLMHIKRYAKPDLHASLQAAKQINDYVYDWSLNEPVKRGG